MLKIALVPMLVVWWSGAVLAQDRTQKAVDCIKKAMTTGLERLVPLKLNPTRTNAAEALARMERNSAKRAQQARTCINADEARALGRLSLFVDVFAEGCGMKDAPVLRPSVHPLWGDTDLLNGAATAYRGNMIDGIPSGEFFQGEDEFRKANRSTPTRSPGQICENLWSEFGPQGSVFPGVLVRTRSSNSAGVLNAKSTGQQYIEATTEDRFAWAFNIATLAGLSVEPQRTLHAIQIVRCLDAAFTGKGSAATRQMDIGFASAFCSAGLQTGVTPGRR